MGVKGREVSVERIFIDDGKGRTGDDIMTAQAPRKLP